VINRDNVRLKIDTRVPDVMSNCHFVKFMLCYCFILIRWAVIVMYCKDHDLQVYKQYVKRSYVCKILTYTCIISEQIHLHRRVSQTDFSRTPHIDAHLM